MGFRKPAKTLDQAALFEYALKTLGGRAQSAGEIKEKLRRRAERVTDIDAVMARLKEYGYLNDRKYAEHFAARRLENEGFGRSRVLSDLRTKRVAPAVAERAVNQAFAETDEVALIEQFLERKYRKKVLGEELSDPKKLSAAYRKLRMAGFSGGNSLRVLKRHSRDYAALEALESADEPTPGENSDLD